MKFSGIIALVSVTMIGVGFACAGDATTPVDLAQRNSPFAPSGSVTPDKKTPETNSTVQEKRVDKTTVDKKQSTVGERRAPIEMTEARDKNVREKDSHRPEKIEQPTSAFNHRDARYSTAEDTKRQPMVTKYQDSLTSASATNMARFPALGNATGAKLNRFVFRKNGPETPVALEGAAITPAGGAAAVQKK